MFEMSMETKVLIAHVHVHLYKL